MRKSVSFAALDETAGRIERKLERLHEQMKAERKALRAMIHRVQSIPVTLRGWNSYPPNNVVIDNCIWMIEESLKPGPGEDKWI